MARCALKRVHKQDDDHELNEAITREYHFCGGDLFTRKAHTGGEPEDGVDGAEPHRKTKKEVRHARGLRRRQLPAHEGCVTLTHSLGLAAGHERNHREKQERQA